ncbi:MULTISPECIES: DUF1343 domain-containing protein [unclassified Paenibacillus]|uniref:exo-beta-N-acetylmuramidase NamZ family protein n=1 Tax=unclassified Paenibacillus TaxID=185978 RepID=UPI00020D75F1|nr:MULTISPECIES: DUF1343 domain-containing protein [unclassified Paenibacillus]EGL16248.1 hypothetical protein HMPREF9413_2752 [Paenibacillus sp. HGF7]EPD86019.1 hypothetical protein HMPREF1207_02974 [Paenibacillus sp. HGH0039]
MQGKVKTGADRFPEMAPALLKGRKFGLLTNPTGINRDFQSTIQVCASLEEAELGALFACEHGIRGERQAGVRFEDEIDPELGIPVYSLYGKHKKPTADMLSGLQAMVFDIQDLGVRFYTYLSTLIYTLEACAEAGVRVIVLDRPNPLGGLEWEGGLLDESLLSMVGAWRMPARTGMTIGEFALLAADQMKTPCELYVVKMEGWDREMEFPDTGLPWLPPSPNMPTMDTVRIYAGHCLFEGTNLSEGRGTTKPFEQVGAPWLKAEETCRELNALNLPGVRFHPVTFTPTFSKHAGQLCNGVMTFVTDPKVYKSAVTGLHLLSRIQRLHPDEFEWLAPFKVGQSTFIDLLSGSDRIRLTLHEPGALEAIIASWERDGKEWAGIRSKYLLYGPEAAAGASATEARGNGV